MEQSEQTQQLLTDTENGDRESPQRRELQAQQDERQQQQQEQQREQQQQQRQQRDEEDRRLETDRLAAVDMTVRPQESQQSEEEGEVPTYQTNKIVKIMEPRVTRSMTKGGTNALMTYEVGEHTDAFICDDTNNISVDVNGFESDEKTRAWMTNVLLSKLEGGFSENEIQAYATGIVNMLPMHDANAWIEKRLCYRVGLTEAMREQNPAKRKMILDALDDEVENLVRKTKAVIPVHPNTLTRKEISDRIPGHTFLKFKELANGDFERVKARTVAGGNQVDPDTVGETKAPTVNIVSVMSLISLSTSVGFEIRSADIEGAFLIPEL